jgi:hypothetical protein
MLLYIYLFFLYAGSSCPFPLSVKLSTGSFCFVVSQLSRPFSVATLRVGGHRVLAMLFFGSVSSGEVRTGGALWPAARVTTADSSSLFPCSARAVVRKTTRGSPALRMPQGTRGSRESRGHLFREALFSTRGPRDSQGHQSVKRNWRQPVACGARAHAA